MVTDFQSWYDALTVASSLDISEHGDALIVQLLEDSDIQPVYGYRVDVHFPKHVIPIVQRVTDNRQTYKYDAHLYYCIFHSIADAYGVTQQLAAETLLPIKQW